MTRDPLSPVATAQSIATETSLVDRAVMRILPREVIVTATGGIAATLMRWWPGRDDDVLTVCEIDLRVGEAWRFVVRGSDGRESRFKGVYPWMDNVDATCAKPFEPAH